MKNQIICQRKSIRKYDLNPLDDAALEAVREQIKKLVPLYPEIPYSITIADQTKRSAPGVKAPHFLLFGSEEKEGSLENIGFLGQQMDLFFSGAGIGSCWLGMAKPEEKTDCPLPYVIGMSFGKPVEPLHRTADDFKRKPLSAISEGSDPRLEAARLAPSAVNAQDWYFIAEQGKIHCYRRKANPLLGFMFDKLGKIDLGIALCHLAEESADFKFDKETGAPARKGYIYTGTVG
jgi:nitroreductase